MRYGSVCSGIEAATVAWHPLGWEPVFFSEIEPFPCAVLKHHYPDVPNLGDMTKYKDWSVKDGAIELLVGGTPCQSFSVAGLRKGLADPRGNLALVYLGLLDHLRPRWMVWENVPGVLSSNGGKDFGAFLGGLAELGYGFAYRVLDAQYFGVPQRRRRVFVVGYFGDWRPAASVLFERESLSGDTPPRREKGERVAGGVEVGPSGGRFTDTCPTLDARCKDGFIRNQIGAGVMDVAHALTKRYDSSEDGTGRGTPLVMAHGQGNAEVVKDGSPSLTCTHEAPIVAIQDGHGMDKAQNGKGFDDSGVGYTLDGVSQQAVCLPINTQIATRGEALGEGTGFGIGEDGDPAYTLQAGHEHAVAYHRNASCAVTAQDDKTAALRSNGEHSYQFLQTASTVRRLTPRECCRLQGFPDNYTLIPWRKGMAPDGPRYKALGNSMAVPVMSWIGERLTATRGGGD